MANRIIRSLTAVDIRDNGCSLKAYRRELLDQIRLYSDMHRFIPALSAGIAGARITEVPVRHHPRRHGSSKYGLSRVGKVLADLITITMIRSFRLRPLALYSLAASVALVLSLGTGTIALVARQNVGANALLVYPAVSLTFFALAAYLVMLGLVGEVVVGRAKTDRRRVPLVHTLRSRA